MTITNLIDSLLLLLCIIQTISFSEIVIHTISFSGILFNTKLLFYVKNFFSVNEAKQIQQISTMLLL